MFLIIHKVSLIEREDLKFPTKDFPLLLFMRRSAKER